VFIAAITTFISFWLLNGFTLKTLCAVLGTVSGIAIAGLVSSIAGELAHLTGFNTQEAETLMLVARDYRMQVRGILFAGILIASLGAIMDVAMSVDSAIYEMIAANPKLTKSSCLSPA
jgi:Predicted multitransmembrane protein